MSGANWDLKPSKILMNQRDYRDLVIYSLVEEGWSQRKAEKEADRRLEAMSKDQETHLKEAVETLSKLDFSEGAKTFAGTLLRDTFKGTFPPAVSSTFREEFFAKGDRPEPLMRAFYLGNAYRSQGLTPEEEAEWELLQETHP